MTSHDDLTIHDVRTELEKVRTVMLTSIDEAGTLSSRPLTLLDLDINGDPWFLVDAQATWVGPIDVAPVNIAVATEDFWVSFAGRASIERDPARIADLRNAVTDAFFAEDAEPVALRVATEQIEWWASDGALRTALQVAKAAVTGGSPDLGASGTIDAR
ncbi:MAG: pyridoxamine 5'-phosphate oxidase family protein [Acidimicrobiales bacterium]